MKKLISMMLIIAIFCMCITPQIAMAAENDILYNTVRTDFELNEANGANAKMFMIKDGPEHSAGEGYTDYVKGLDYEGYLKYDTSREGIYPTGTESDALASGSIAGAFVYTVDGKDNNGTYNDYVNFTTKNDKLYWNIDGVDYLMNPEEKAIKLYNNVKTDDVQNSELAARFNTLNEVTLDVADGNYYEVGFLAACSYNRTLSVTLMYKDGTSEEKKVSVPSNLTNAGQSTGAVYFQNVKTHAIASLIRRFKPHKVMADTTKTLDKVKLKSNYYANAILIISAWGEMPSVKSMLDKVTDADALTEENYLSAQQELESFMGYVAVCGLTYDDLDADMKAKVDAIKNPFNQILSNMIEKLDENEQITGENIYTIKAQLEKIESYKADNSLTYSTEQKTKLETIKNNIRAVEERVVIEDIINRISNLPMSEEITTDNFSEISQTVKEINKIMEENGILKSSITNIADLEAVEAKLEVVSQDITAVIPLDIQDGANVKLFLEKNEEEPNYVPWADYIASAYIGAVSATTTYTPRVLRYSETEPSSTSLINAPGKIWTVSGVPFKIGSDILGIRLHGARSVTSGDSNVNTIMNSYKEATISLEKGYYSKLHILAANPHGYDKDAESDMTYVITYKDGTKIEGGIAVHYNPTLESYSPSYGYIFGTNIVPGGSGATIVRFADYIIEVDSSKQLDTIKFASSDTQRMIYIAGVSGETAKLSVIKSAIESRLNYTIPAVGTDNKSTLLEIEDLVKEYEAAGADAGNIEGISKFEADISAYYEGIVEIESTKADTDFENSYFEAIFTKNISIGEDIVAVKKGSEYLTADKFSVTIEGKKLLVTIPDTHKETAEYTVEIEKGVQNADNSLFYIDKEIRKTFNSVKAISIDKFELADGTVTAVVSNNMANKTQDFVLIIGAYDEDNKKVGMKMVQGILNKKGETNSTIEAALNASDFANGVKIECYLADSMDTIKYLDRAAAITVNAQ